LEYECKHSLILAFEYGPNQIGCGEVRHAFGDLLIFRILDKPYSRTHVSIRLRRSAASGMSLLSLKQRILASCSSPANSAWFRERVERWFSLRIWEIDSSETLVSRFRLRSSPGDSFFFVVTPRLSLCFVLHPD
jgi:hypothetical protein